MKFLRELWEQITSPVRPLIGIILLIYENNFGIFIRDEIMGGKKSEKE